MLQKFSTYPIVLRIRCSLLLILALTVIIETFLLNKVAVAQDTTAGKPSTTAPSEFYIDDIFIEGNRRIDTAAIKAQIKGAHGKVSKQIVSEDIKTLYNTGFFDQVTASLARRANDPNSSILKYVIVEKPIVRKVFIKGNKEIKEEDLTEPLKLGANRFLDKNKIDIITKNLSAFYQSKGYYDVSFENSVVAASDQQVDLTFTVNEGVRYAIETIEIRGLKEASESEILSAIQTKTHTWYSSWILGTGRLNKEMLENDKAIMRQYFLDHGFVEAAVGDPQIEKEDGEINIYFDVIEGAQYKVGKIFVSGDLIANDKEKTLEDTKVEAGRVFNASEIREDTFKISDKFTNIGFAYANVVPDTAVNKDSRTVDLTFKINKGSPVSVNRINIKGNDKTYDNVIRRTLKVSEQEKFSSGQIKRSQQLLERLGYFEEVNISQQPTDDPNKVDLLVNVREGSTGTFSIGAGYASSDGAIFSSKISENNLFGTGKSLSLTGDFGAQRNNVILSYTDPRLNDSYVSLGMQALVTQRIFLDFTNEQSGANASLGYPLEQLFGESFNDIQAYSKYEFMNIDITEVEDYAAQLVKDSEGKSTVSSVTPSLVRNTLNNPMNPTKGSRQVISYEFAGLGGSEDFTLIEGRNQWYQPIWKTEEHGDFTFSLRTTVGYGQNDGDEPFPLFRRYFPGGINSVRGFNARTLGPADENGNKYGGSKQLINNAEVIFPLINSAGLRGVVFYDMGQAFDDNVSINIGELRRAYGFGLRWFSPMGLIRVEFGFPADREPGEDSNVTLFSFGAPI